MKKISIINPCFNEEDNVEPMYETIKSIMKELPYYEYEHIFIDNCSTDRTREVLLKISREDKRVKCIFNLKNYGPGDSGIFAMYQATGDAIICLPTDFQEPPELIPTFLEKWEEGNKVVLGQREKTEANKLMEFIRKIYYKVIKVLSRNEELERVTGFGLYDKEVMDWIKWCDDKTPSLRNIIMDLGYKPFLIQYTQRKRKSGKSSYNFFSYLREAINNLLLTSTTPLEIITIFGMICAFISAVVAFIYLILKLSNWYGFSAGMAPIVIGLFFLGSVQLISIGIIGEYIGSITNKLQKRPKVIPKEMINFEGSNKNEKK